MSQDVLGYPDTVATAPKSQVRVVLSVLGCPRMSWDIPSQWLQPLSPRSKWSYLSWNVTGCPGISRQWLQPLSPRSKRSYLSWDVLGYPNTVATAPESQVRVVLSVLGCPRMSWDIPTVATAPESQVRVVLSVLGCPRMSWDIPTQWLQPLSPRSEWSYLSWDVPGCPGISRHSGYSP